MQSYFITFKSWYFEFKTFWGPADTLKLNWRKLFVFKLEVCVELIHEVTEKEVCERMDQRGMKVWENQSQNLSAPVCFWFW